ncbi:MAG: FeoA family protein [bacterium]
MTLLSLTEMKSGQRGKISEIKGGTGARQKLESMGISIGKNIFKFSGVFLKGPVTVQIGTTQLSIGHGIASKVIIEVNQ